MPTIAKVDVIFIDGVPHARQPDGSFTPLKGESDWARVDAMTDPDLAEIAARDDDAVEFNEEDWAEAVAERRLRLAANTQGKLKLR